MRDESGIRGAPPLVLQRRTLVLTGGVAAAAALVGSGPASGAGGQHGHHLGHHHGHSRRSMARLTMTAGGMVQHRGANFRSGGVNAFQLITNDYPSPRLMTYPEIDALFAKALAVKATVLRAHTLAASVGNPFTLVRGVTGTGPNPTIVYDPAVWTVIDYAVWRARQLGIYLIAPFVDEWGFYHGGKRQWVDFRRPGSVDLDPSVTSANSAAERSAEDAFYTDPQISWDFEQYIRDWLEHVNPHTGVAFKDEPALSIVQVGNELWTAAQDAPGWVAAKAALIKSIAPSTLVMDSGADGLAVHDMAWSCRDIDILETHPYTIFGAADLTGMAAFAASQGKAFAVGEYPWSASSAPSIEAAVRGSGNVVTSALWSLQNNQDLHDEGAGFGTEDVSFYVPGKNPIERAAVHRVTAHGRWMRRHAASSVPPSAVS